MQYDFAIGFVTYNPTKDFLSRLKLLNKLGCRAYLYDNSPDFVESKQLVNSLEHISYITAGKNLGLGIGLSTVCAQAYYDSFPTLLFFDQDTIFNEETINYIQAFIVEKINDVQDEYTLIVFGEDKYYPALNRDEVVPGKFDFFDVNLAISSGSLFILKNLKKIGWHNEKYFVDGVDYEICLKSVAKNLKIGKCLNAPGFDHSSEQPDKIYKIFGTSISLRCYSFSRVLDTTKSNIRLFFSSIRMRQFKFAFSILRSYGIYSAAQILARIYSK
jgi:rhamnosyltransferase